MLYSYMLCSIY